MRIDFFDRRGVPRERFGHAAGRDDARIAAQLVAHSRNDRICLSGKAVDDARFERLLGVPADGNVRRI